MLYFLTTEYQNKYLNTETKEHVENVSKIVMLIASHFNFSKDEQILLGELGKFHDIGKIIVGMDIIEKTGPLTNEEYEKVKKHPEYGRNILKEFGFSDKAAKIIYQHHEKCDGSGYPLGLKKDEILLESKIIGIADTIDALLSCRVYKKSWSTEKVKKFFIKNEESFCQEVIDVVVDNFDEILKLRKMGDIK